MSVYQTLCASHLQPLSMKLVLGMQWQSWHVWFGSVVWASSLAMWMALANVHSGVDIAKHWPGSLYLSSRSWESSLAQASRPWQGAWSPNWRSKIFLSSVSEGCLNKVSASNAVVAADLVLSSCSAPQNLTWQSSMYTLCWSAHTMCKSAPKTQGLSTPARLLVAATLADSSASSGSSVGEAKISQDPDLLALLSKDGDLDLAPWHSAREKCNTTTKTCNSSNVKKTSA